MKTGEHILCPLHILHPAVEQYLFVFKINDPIHAYYIVQATARICSERKLSLEASYTARLIKEMIL